MKIIKYWVLLLFLIFLKGLGLTQAGPKIQEWHSPPYEIQLSYHYTSRCNPGYCEGEKILEFVANAYNVAFGHSFTPDFPCCYYDSELGVTLPLWGHSEGDAQVTDIEICPHLSGAGVEPQNIVSRNNNFTINLSILPMAIAKDIEEQIREEEGYELEPTTIAPQVWFQFQAITPFSNPAYEWETSDGNGLNTSLSVFFRVALLELMNGNEIMIEVPEVDECGKGEWNIRFQPQK